MKVITNRLYEKLEDRLPALAPWLSMILYGITLVLLDVSFRYVCRFAQVISDAETRKLFPFTLGWALVLTGIAILLPPLFRRIYMAATGVILVLLCVVHGVYINMFRKFFSFADMTFAGDGAAFADLSYFVISKSLLVCLLCCLLLFLIAVALVPTKTIRYRKRAGGIALLIGILTIITVRFFVLGSSEDVVWDQNKDPAFLYEDFSDTRACLPMLGIYQYTFRDLTALLPRAAVLTEAEQQEIAAFAAKRVHETNEMSGIFQGKNLILVQLEAIDTWMVDYMSALSQVKEESIVFANHYTPAYITAGTFNTEFMVNTSLLPAASGTSVSVYSQNTFSDSLANLFAEKGYLTNSFHGSEGDVYNRSAIHENLGYEAYHSGSDMGMENYTMDSQLVGAFDQMTAEKPFFSFVITYSGHGPYGEDNPIYLAHAEEAKAEATRQDGNYVYAVAHAKETDAFVEGLMAKLKETGLSKDTVVVFYADHYNYYMMDDALNMDIKGVDDLNLLQHTDFFIWSEDTEPMTVDKYTSSIDILPTLANLFGLSPDYRLLTGEDAFGSAEGYVFFNDNTWIGEGNVSTETIVERRNISQLLLAGDYWAHTDNEIS